MHAKTNAHEQTIILVQCSHNSRWSEGNDKRLFCSTFFMLFQAMGLVLFGDALVPLTAVHNARWRGARKPRRTLRLMAAWPSTVSSNAVEDSMPN